MKRMAFVQNGIQQEWHFVIGNGANDQQEFYKELKKQLAPQIKTLNLKSGYANAGGRLLNKKIVHFTEYGGYRSLTCAEPFGLDLQISWYLYFKKAAMFSSGTGFGLAWNDLKGQITGKTRDKVIAFGAIGKGCAERATKAILSQTEAREVEQSGSLIKS